MFGGNPEGGFNELLQEAAKIKGTNGNYADRVR